MPCTSSSTIRAGQPWDKPGDDDDVGEWVNSTGTCCSPGLGSSPDRLRQQSPRCQGALQVAQRAFGRRGAVGSFQAANERLEGEVLVPDDPPAGKNLGIVKAGDAHG